PASLTPFQARCGRAKRLARERGTKPHLQGTRRSEMRRNPALATIILCVAPLGLAAQTSEGILPSRGQSEPSTQHSAPGQHTDHPAAPGLNVSDQRKVRAHEGSSTLVPDAPPGDAALNWQGKAKLHRTLGGTSGTLLFDAASVEFR